MEVIKTTDNVYLDMLLHSEYLIYGRTCQIQRTKGPGKCAGLYRMSEYSGFILVIINILWDHKYLSDVTECRKTQVSDCTSSTAVI